MTQLKISEAKAHFGKYARLAEKGDEFIIADRNKAIAKLVGIPGASHGVRPKLGIMEGQASIPENFDEPLPEFENTVYGE